MTKELVASFRDRVFSYIEERLVVDGPRNVVYAFNFFRQQHTCSKIFDLQGVLAVTAVIGAISQEITIVARNKSADAHELLTFSQFILVQHDFFGCFNAPTLPAKDWILFTLDRSCVVEVIAPTIR